MFAPSPIQIRYDDGGALAAGAAGAGANAGYARQKAMDMQLIEQQSAQAQQFAAQQAQAQQLQQAQQLAVQRVQGNPTNAVASSRGNSPFTQAVQASKAAALQSAVASGDIDANDPIAKLAAASPDVDATQLVKLLEDRKKAKTTDAATQSDLTAKQQVAASANLTDPNDSATLKGMIASPKFSMDDVRKFITESQQRTGAAAKGDDQNARQLRQETVLQYRTQAKAKRAEASQIISLHRDALGGNLDNLNPSDKTAYMHALALRHEADQLDSKAMSAISDDSGGASSQQQQQYQIGQVVHTPKGDVKIAGFDTDGHPLVNPL